MRAAGKAAGRGLRAKLLGTTAGKVLLVVLAVAVVATGGVAIFATRGGLHPGGPGTTAQQPAGTVTKFSLPNPKSSLGGITAGPDGNVWFTELNYGFVGRITPTGQITKFPGGGGMGITAGPDGNLWFTEGGSIGRITPTGKITEFPVGNAADTFRITAGKDGTLWFTDIANPAQIGRITTAGQVTEFPISRLEDVLPQDIAAGPDGTLWFTDLHSGAVWRITPGGQIDDFSVSAASGGTLGITAGPDGNLWFTVPAANPTDTSRIGRITPGGQVTTFPILMKGYAHQLGGIAAGPDGNLWFTDGNIDQIGRITPAGKITTFPVSAPGGGDPDWITKGPDGNLWFTESDGKIGRISPGVGTSAATPPRTGNTPTPTAGATLNIMFFALPTPQSAPGVITAGPDGNLWFTEQGQSDIGRITPTGQITEFPLPKPTDVAGITAGPDGNLWFTETQGNGIGRITPTGQITEFPLPSATRAYPGGITAGPDGNLWFTENTGNRIGRITPAGQITEFPIPTTDSRPGAIPKGPDGPRDAQRAEALT